jgi:hypothetical protein
MVKAGVAPERIAPGNPEQNGRHERMHLILLQDAAMPPARSLPGCSDWTSSSLISPSEIAFPENVVWSACTSS